MNIQSQQTPETISDDQELAKVLAGVNQQADDAADDQSLQTPEPPVPAQDDPASASPDVNSSAPIAPGVTPQDSDLEAVKGEAIQELRPLVDKLNVPADEKFDTYLLLLRSTDDRELIAPAHEAAKAIEDEAKRAQALLDIIKEIDYLSGKSQQPAA